jgi:homoserine kinase
MPKAQADAYQEFIKGLWRDNPVFVQVLGMCPMLAVTNSAVNALAMGGATFFVLVASSFLVSSLKRWIPKQVRISTYVIIIATFVTVTGVREAEAAAARYMDVRHALDTGDMGLLIRSSGNRIVEPIRAELVRGLDALHRLVADLNEGYDPQRPRFACGISGSGPTMYVLTDSHATAELAGYEAHRMLLKLGISSWWFCHRPNPNGAKIIELH